MSTDRLLTNAELEAIAERKDIARAENWILNNDFETRDRVSASLDDIVRLLSDLACYREWCQRLLIINTNNDFLQSISEQFYLIREMRSLMRS